MKQTLKGIKVEYDHPISIFCDNRSTINIPKNIILNSRTKHFTIKHHFLRKQAGNQQIKLEYVSTKEQIADLFTKPLPKKSFIFLREKLRVIQLHH